MSIDDRHLDRVFFKGELKKLVSQFGEQSFSEHKIMLIYNELRHLSEKQVSQVVDEIIGNCRTRPILEDFRREVSKIRSSSEAKKRHSERSNSKGILTPAQMQKSLSELKLAFDKNELDKLSDRLKRFDEKLKIDCPQCRDDGLVYAKKNIYEAVFKCSCAAGKRRKESMPTFSQSDYLDGWRPINWEK